MRHDPGSDGRAAHGRQAEASIHAFPNHRPGSDHGLAESRARTGPSWVYLLAWLLLAAGAGLYVAATHFGGYQRAAVAEAEEAPDPAIEELSRELASARDAQDDLNETIVTLKSELATLQERVDGLSLADQIIVARVTGVEKGKPLSREAVSELVRRVSQSSPEETSSVSTASGYEAPPLPAVDAGAGAGGSAQAADAAKDANRLSSAAESIADTLAAMPDEESVPEDAAATFGQEADQAEAQEQPKKQTVAAVVPATPSVTKEAKVEATSAQPAAPAKSFGVELAVSTSPEALRLNWDLLVERHPAELGGLTARAGGASDGNLRLLAGPFASAAEAKRLCKRLQEVDVACRSAEFSGSPL